MTSQIPLLALPNELLIEVASHMFTSDLKRFGQSTRKIYYFVEYYLGRYRYNKGISRLSDNIILKTVKHLSCQVYRRNLAQTCYRFYPLITNFVYHQDAEDRSSLIPYAAARNLMRMASRMIRAGADLEYSPTLYCTPLEIAARNGYEEMAKMLLRAGASRTVEGYALPLFSAIYKRHKSIAILLSEGSDMNVILLLPEKLTALKLACKHKLVNLVRYYLERGACKLATKSSALWLTLETDSVKEGFIKRKVHQDVFEIVMLLMNHGADPDILCKFSSSGETSRKIASLHPDPRIRAYFYKTTP
ncbi:ankyrin [Corynespora cassiicola Philippines]|uniref:Ankyrin n=1 Tax=Corynespora cassiicola Philippines TaxID=1448308 RepID=A0A2T2P6P0_CORCC|nr:ankyrin [Corynespora cassiicola Philippines]